MAVDLQIQGFLYIYHSFIVEPFVGVNYGSPQISYYYVLPSKEFL